ncbi:glycoprotein O [Human betaherpesvirus 6A]|uniref:120 kDa Glycoprotein O n=1 Tax=Human herpesvirus 6A (strain Uganda-1102) TaxID=10370 RepID=GO_HHV6U|nr:glycoprotein O [Human betaherpesvirus 6A]Q06093.1 RecName: Full=120 kDa Glycoprotein O; Short=gO-120K; AltName: Full=Glycoprotein U47; Contains: RecName: Full=80 kDa Glycoprotein O; Short=gO-80K; Flags: Precursor [Human herpesvirus 6 (strain Uganda-1102)]CAA45602.1 BHLF2 [Human betaherpesvirus 6A]CAA58381.1 glycoprotein O [Human betaherpesvirus 6A]
MHLEVIVQSYKKSKYYFSHTFYLYKFIVVNSPDMLHISRLGLFLGLFAIVMHSVNLIKYTSDPLEAFKTVNRHNWSDEQREHFYDLRNLYTSFCQTNLSLDCFTQILTNVFSWDIRDSQCKSAVSLSPLQNLPRTEIKIVLSSTTANKSIIASSFSLFYLLFATLSTYTADPPCVELLPFKILGAQLFDIKLTEESLRMAMSKFSNSNLTRSLTSFTSKNFFNYTSFVYFLLYNTTSCVPSNDQYFKQSPKPINVTTSFGRAIVNFDSILTTTPSSTSASLTSPHIPSTNIPTPAPPPVTKNSTKLHTDTIKVTPNTPTITTQTTESIKKIVKRSDFPRPMYTPTDIPTLTIRLNATIKTEQNTENPKSPPKPTNFENTTIRIPKTLESATATTNATQKIESTTFTTIGIKEINGNTYSSPKNSIYLKSKSQQSTTKFTDAEHTTPILKFTTWQNTVRTYMSHNTEVQNMTDKFQRTTLKSSNELPTIQTLSVTPKQKLPSNVTAKTEVHITNNALPSSNSSYSITEVTKEVKHTRMSASTHEQINHTEIAQITPILNAHTSEKSTTPQRSFTAETFLTTSSKPNIITWSNLLTTTPKEPLTNTSLRWTDHITTQLTTSNRTQSAKLTKANISSQTTNIYPQTITGRSTEV